MKYTLFVLAALLPICATAQTKFVTAPTLVGGPISTLSGLACSVGQVFFATDATPGQNLYFCTATNTWSQQVAGGGGSATANVATAAISGATATLFPLCAGVGCNVDRGGGQIDNFTATNTLTAPASGTGIVWVYWTSSGCAIASNATLVNGVGSGPCAVTGIAGSGFPNNATADITTLTYNTGVWTDVKNVQPTASNPPNYAAGLGLTQISSSGTTTFQIDTSATSVGTGTANFVPRWVGNSYTLGAGLMQDNGTALGFNCAPGAVLALFCSNGAAVKAVAMSNSNAGGHSEFQLFNDGGLIGAFGVGGSTASDHASGLYLYNNTGSFDGWMNTGWTFRTGTFPGTLRMTIPTTGGVQVATATEPTCDSTKAGTFFYVQGNSTTKDKVEVCAHDASNVYAWRTIY